MALFCGLGCGFLRLELVWSAWGKQVTYAKELVFYGPCSLVGIIIGHEICSLDHFVTSYVLSCWRIMNILLLSEVLFGFTFIVFQCEMNYLHNEYFKSSNWPLQGRMASDGYWRQFFLMLFSRMPILATI